MCEQGAQQSSVMGQLLYFLEDAGCVPVRPTTNARVKEPRPLKRLTAHLMAGLVRRAARRHGMYDATSHSDDLPIGGLLIVVAREVRAKRIHGELS